MTHRHVSICREYKSIFGDEVTLSIPEIKVPIEYYRKGSPSQVIASDSFTYIVQIKFSNRLLYVPVDFTVSQLVKTMLVQLDYSEDSEYFVYFDGICFVASDASDELIPLESKEASLVNSLENWFHQLFVCVICFERSPIYIEGSVQCRNANVATLRSISNSHNWNTFYSNIFVFLHSLDNFIRS